MLESTLVILENFGACRLSTVIQGVSEVQLL